MQNFAKNQFIAVLLGLHLPFTATTVDYPGSGYTRPAN